jgi:small redox-active disulfide protein 2
MLTIKVLGSGCPNCKKVEQQTLEALEMLAEERPDLEATVLHVTERDKIMAYPILATPGLVIDEKLVSGGRIPSVDEIKGWIQEALA